MVQLTSRISLATREWLDKECLSHEFRSYGHAVDKMAVFYRKGHRVIGNLKTENARLRERVGLYESGRLEQEAQSPDVGGSERTEKNWGLE